VVLEAREPLCSVPKVRLDYDVADQAAARLAHRAKVGDAHTGKRLAAGELVGAAEQLIPAAHREHRGLARERRLDRVALGLDEVARDQRLVAVLASSDVEELMRLGVDAFAGPGGRERKLDFAP